MTRQLISTFRQPPLHYLTRSVRRTGGFVLTGKPELILKSFHEKAGMSQVRFSVFSLFLPVRMFLFFSSSL